MLETFKIFPLWLTITTIVFVILPAILSAFTRRSLYQHLRDLEKKTRRLVNGDSEGIQPRFINLLQQRFTKSSQQIENVNTIALIDGVYHQETITFLNIKIRCEEAEYITKTIPNLLLAFGLLGTFLGITLNLNSISQIINTGGTNIIDLTSQLQQPLQSMGIAFITSLIGLFCASILTIINLKYNISLEKNSLLNNLEDYLDNIYKPLVEGDTRLDKAVNKMVDKQTEFLERFHEKVGQVLERTFKQAADRIAEENEKSVKLATQIYNALWEVSSSLNTGANTFQLSMDKLASQVKNLDNIVVKLDKNINNFANSSQLILQASNKIEASKFSENLEKITDNLAQIQREFTLSTKELTQSVIIFHNDSKKATDLALNIYQELKTASESLEESSVLFADSATTIKESQFTQNLLYASDNLKTIKEQFLDLIDSLHHLIKPLENNIQTFNLSIHKMSEISPNYQQFANSIELLDKSANIFIQSAETIKESKFNDSLQETTSNIIKMENIFLENIKNFSDIVEPITINIRTLKLSSNKMQQLAENIDQIQSNINMINDRYLEMTNTSGEILLKLGEMAVNTNNSHSQVIDNLNRITKQFSDNFNNNYPSLIGELGQDISNNNYDLKGLTYRLISEVKQKAKDINYLSRIEGDKILTETAFKYLPKIEERLRETANQFKQYHYDHIDKDGRKCTPEEAEIIANELRYLGMEIRNIQNISDLRLMYRVTSLFSYQISRFRHYKANKNNLSLSYFINNEVLNILNECMAKSYYLS
ncbi:MotA/TolQ/ExbB proton channel family protein [Geminocystis herdmanii]|uniref:MotA/TolQ/ExbB proton channel family protein n=1 Tax=Geminocystis herdmanii TaxID=669359 RepID=UPI000347740B|nr:MotA/TolQ/ExbB proton channel family protein [Geminocystis herdmanii]